jgi:hypothetical protein
MKTEKALREKRSKETLKCIKMMYPNTQIVVDEKDETITIGKGYEQGKKDRDDEIYKQLRKISKGKLGVGDFLNWLQDLVLGDLK